MIAISRIRCRISTHPIQMSNVPVVVNDPARRQIAPAQTMADLREQLAIQAFAYHKGLLDRNMRRPDAARNPFDAKHDHDWAMHYHRGRNSRALAVFRSPNQLVGYHQDANLLPVFNPNTGNVDDPQGIYDPVRLRQLCSSDLDGMEATVGKVAQRGREWERHVCDVSADTREAIVYYPDLKARYEKLQSDAQEALAGRRPPGY